MSYLKDTLEVSTNRYEISLSSLGAHSVQLFTTPPVKKTNSYTGVRPFPSRPSPISWPTIESFVFKLSCRLSLSTNEPCWLDCDVGYCSFVLCIVTSIRLTVLCEAGVHSILETGGPPFCKASNALQWHRSEQIWRRKGIMCTCLWIRKRSLLGHGACVWQRLSLQSLREAGASVSRKGVRNWDSLVTNKDLRCREHLILERELSLINTDPSETSENRYIQPRSRMIDT